MTSIRKVRTCLIALAAAGLAAAGAADAAQQGEMGATSSGSVGISLSVAPRARISGLKDISVSDADPASNLRTAQTVCVWSNSPAGAYTLTAGGSGSGGAFELAGGQQTLAYSVEWAQGAGQASGQTLPGGQTATSLQAAATQSDCGSGTGSASLVVAFNSDQLAAVQPDTAYTGALTLTISPQ
jgi:hypothetical protein